MTVYVLRRLAQTLLVLFVTSGLVFGGLYLVGDPVEILVNPNADEIEKLRTAAALGLDRPVFEQYGIFLKGAFSGDLGRSFVFGRPALEVIFERMPATLELAFLAMVISVVLGVPLGLYAGLRPDSFGAKAVMAGSILGFSLPTFWVGLLLILVFAVQLGWLPSNGRGETVAVAGVAVSFLTADGIAHLAMPAVNLALFKLSLLIRLTRAGTREAVLQDYVKFARAKGLSPARVTLVHVCKNIMIPIVTVVGLELGSTIAFSVVTETIFAWPGMGKLIIDSINVLDRPVMVAYLMVIVVMFVVINLVVDLLYYAVDPRLRIDRGPARAGGH